MSLKEFVFTTMCCPRVPWFAFMARYLTLRRGRTIHRRSSRGESKMGDESKVVLPGIVQ